MNPGKKKKLEKYYVGRFGAHWRRWGEKRSPPLWPLGDHFEDMTEDGGHRKWAWRRTKKKEKKVKGQFLGDLKEVWQTEERLQSLYGGAGRGAPLNTKHEHELKKEALV